MNYKNVLGYLKIKESLADEKLLSDLKRLEKELLCHTDNLFVYKVFDCKADKNGVIVGNRIFESANLQNHLDGCEKCAVMAATLGRGADRLIAKKSVSDISDAAILQALCTELIEQLCDEVCEKIALEAKAEGCSVTTRYSPGYGDLPLLCQRDVFALLDCQKELGLTLNDSLLMTPAKSVTALVGLRKTTE